ncbi:RNA polymerase sigma factor SigI [Bacillus sp. SM2101]|uniref:RNA polymerase sigma factor SigI n=1 Tax=Bacillaceae TaxID=186817 RepID=UPI001BDDEDCE
MLSLLFKIGKKEKSLEAIIGEIQNGNSQLHYKIIKKYHPFIAKTVSSVCKRYIDETDDEFSIGLIAFNDAIEKFEREKGRSFLAFAELIIKRRVIDYIRKQARNRSIPYDLHERENDVRPQTLESHLSFEEYGKQVEQERRKEEIEQYKQDLKTFGLTFQDLVNQSPKHADARQNAITVAKILVDHEELRASLLAKKQLPIKQLEKQVKVSRKTIERNRKYIIAISVILTGDYLFLKEYLKEVI